MTDTAFSPASAREQTVLVALVDRISDGVEGETASVDDLVAIIGDDSFTPIVFVCALLVATPLSGIPMFSSLMGMTIFLVSAQMLLQRDRVWLPRWLLRRKISSSALRSALNRLRPALTWVDARSRDRLSVLARRPIKFVPQILCMMSGLIMPNLEFIPFSSSMMGMAVSLLALGLLTRDGAILILASVPYVGLGWLIAQVL